MKVQKITKNIELHNLVDVEIKGITLPSIEEYTTAEVPVYELEDQWWLRTPVCEGKYVAYVYPDGSVEEGGDIPLADYYIRPALLISATGLKVGDMIEFGGYKWTMIHEDMALCNEEISCEIFDASSTDYDNSYIKKYLDEWLKQNSPTDPLGISPKGRGELTADDITGITLLTEEEFRKIKFCIPLLIEEEWWLKSPGGNQNFATHADSDGVVVPRRVIYTSGVRPALQLTEEKAISLKVSLISVVSFGGYSWTLISDNMAFCDSLLDGGYRPFHSSYDNTYETSDIKKYIENWLEEQKEQMVNKNPNLPSYLQFLSEGFSTVGEIVEALSKIPADTPCSPFGSSEAAILYDSDAGLAYMDEMSFFEQEFFLTDEKAAME